MTCAPELFRLPVLDRQLLHAPLDGVLAMAGGDVDAGELLAALAPQLGSGAAPQPRSGPVTAPAFLGLIPTRGCSMDCAYCDFPAPKRAAVMSVELARRAVDHYLALLTRAGAAQARLQFFGGEPLHAPGLVRAAVEHARARSAALGLELHAEATSNGLYGPALTEWVAHNLDAVVLSLDGPPDILDRHRPGLGGRSVADALVRTGRRLSAGPAQLFLRACVTAGTVQRLPEIARWFAQEFRPVAVCFETLHAGARATAAGLAPPDPFEFAEQFLAAEGILAEAGIGAVLSTADITGRPRTSFCPVGDDALIVSPGGVVSACYLLEEDWRARGLDLRLGEVDAAGFALSPAAVQRARDLGVQGKPRCRDCFCRWHCAGGCHARHPAGARPGDYDASCLQTRTISLHRLLRQAGEPELAAAWLADRDAVERAVRQRDDRLVPLGAGVSLGAGGAR